MKYLRQFFHPILKMERKRSKCANSASFPKALYPIVSAPFPPLETPVLDVDYLCIDFETTGLNPLIDQILSIGMVEIYKGFINLKTAEHFYIKGDQQVNEETAIINHIVPELLKEGNDLDTVLNHLFTRMHNKVILVHGLNIEQRFLRHYILRKYNIDSIPWLWVDTLRIERSLFDNQQIQYGPSPSYQLNKVRKDYGLPDYSGHNALIDAVSTAELFLAQHAKVYGKNEKQPYEEIIKRSY